MGVQPEGRKRRRRLSRSAEFERVYRQGESHSGRYVVLHAFPRSDEDETGCRLGVSVGRKVGGAVERNRVKRALREAFWQRAESLPGGHDFVLVARRGIAELIEREGTPGIGSCIEELLSEARLGEDRST